MEKTKTMTFEEQIAALQAQIDFMRSNQTRGVSPARRLQEVRKACREKHFGTWNEMRNGETQYGPDGKTFQDYDAVMDILRREATLLFKYSRGFASSKATIVTLVKSEEDLKEYENICDGICRDLKEKITRTAKAISG